MLVMVHNNNVEHLCKEMADDSRSGVNLINESWSRSVLSTDNAQKPFRHSACTGV